MYNIQLVDPEQWREIPILADYYKNLFYRLYCTNNKGSCERLSRKKAIEHVYIQPNQPSRVTYIVLDIDHQNGIHNALKESLLPPPHLIVQNRKNSHVHLVYKLSTPVCTWGNVRQKPMNYLARIQRGMVRELGADVGYGGNLMKNPVHPQWRTYTTTAPIEGYDLRYLAEFVDLNDLPDAANDEGFGRNCSLFDRLRHYGYRYGSKDYSAIKDFLAPIAAEMNSEFPLPMLPVEVKHIVCSIARYCNRRDFTRSNEKFAKLQSVRAIIRHGDNTTKKEQAKILLAKGMKMDDIAEQVGLSRRTLERSGLRAKK